MRNLRQLLPSAGNLIVFETAGRLLAALAAGDPVGLSLALAPADDEPATDDDIAALDEAYEDLRAGRTLTTEELRRELGL